MCPTRKFIPYKTKLERRYTNYFKVGYNAFEFVLDFGQFFPDEEDTAFHTRLIANPTVAAAFYKLLGESIKQYEQAYERVETRKNDPSSTA